MASQSTYGIFIIASSILLSVTSGHRPAERGILAILLIGSDQQGYEIEPIPLQVSASKPEDFVMPDEKFYDSLENNTDDDAEPRQERQGYSTDQFDSEVMAAPSYKRNVLLGRRQLPRQSAFDLLIIRLMQLRGEQYKHGRANRVRFGVGRKK